MAVADRSQNDADRHVGRLEGIIDQMVKDQAEYRQDMRAISKGIIDQMVKDQAEYRQDMRAISKGIIDQMVKDQAEYRQDMRAISHRIDNVTNRIDKLLYWQLGLLSVIIGGIIGIYFK